MQAAFLSADEYLKNIAHSILELTSPLLAFFTLSRQGSNHIRERIDLGCDISISHWKRFFLTNSISC
ncbi:hypothetical protein GOP47_0029004 [Adiantum capillus-veneris]|nr:hypothetical protein GOP47_0029004 [Adiantum capillus-veneris]